MIPLQNSTVIVTGGASGIGEGLCRRFASQGAKVVVADLNTEEAGRVAESIDGVARHCDVTADESVQTLISSTISDFGTIDYFFANAGIGTGAGLDASDELWDLTWRVNVMGPAIAARHVIPQMEAAGRGTFVVTASAAGLNTGPVSFNYAVTKHAAVGVAEWLAINHGSTVTVQAICPTIVDTPMAVEFGEVMFKPMSVDDVVDSVMEGLESGSFIIAPGPKPMEMFRAKANDWDGFIKNLRAHLPS